MHEGNRIWLEGAKKKYPEHFDGANVLEIGAYDVNGTARDHFKDAKRYVGVDHTAGPGVDVVCEATKTTFKEGEFDTLVYLSVFEHDPLWAEGFERNLAWVRPGALIFVCWGAEGNTPHDPEPWALVPVRDFQDAALKWPIRIVDQFFEVDRFGPGVAGAYDVLARKLAVVGGPVPMLLWCPDCHGRHVDRDEWATREHLTHLCEHCGHRWRPALIPTVGVEYLEPREAAMAKATL